MPSVIDEMFKDKSDKEIRRIEKRIFRDERSSVETLLPSVMPLDNLSMRNESVLIPS